MGYYKSPAWKFKSKMKRRLVPHCQMCGATSNLQAHHLTYTRYRKEEMGDLQTLCKKCHSRVHDKKM